MSRSSFNFSLSTSQYLRIGLKISSDQRSHSMRSMQVRTSSLLMLITFLFTLTGLAQNSQPASQIATLAVQSRQLRFASRRPVEYLRLQVHDQAGSLIHDSGIIPNSDIVWSLKDGHGNALQGGLYDWKLTVKEPSEASPRVKRGQLNLENANEPNSAGSPVQTPVTVTSGSGTVGAIPIWNTPTELGDSVIAQLN